MIHDDSIYSVVNENGLSVNIFKILHYFFYHINKMFWLENCKLDNLMLNCKRNSQKCNFETTANCIFQEQWWPVNNLTQFFKDKRISELNLHHCSPTWDMGHEPIPLYSWKAPDFLKTSSGLQYGNSKEVTAGAKKLLVYSSECTTRLSFSSSNVQITEHAKQYGR